MQILRKGLLYEHSTTTSNTNKLFDTIIIAGNLWISSHWHDYPWNPFFSMLAVTAVIIYYLIANRNNLYASWRIASSWYESLTILKVWILTVLMLSLLSFIIGLTGEFYRKVFFSWTVFVLPCLIIWRLFVRAGLRLARRRGFNIRQVVIVGAGHSGLMLFETIENASWTGLDVIGFFDDKKDSSDLPVDKPVLGKIDQLPEYLKINHIDMVYITLPFDAVKKIIWILNKCRTYGAALYVVPDLLIFELFHSKVEILGDIIFLNFNPYVRWKRSFDITFAIFALLVISPIMLIIAVLIKIENRGPIFYGHQRITSAGKKFKCLKFRTMFVNADKKLAEILANDPSAREEWDKTFKLKNDPRVTKVGQFIRKYSLDELPQFFNVIRGEMSVVGARPIVEKELYDYYKENGGLYCSMKPGITGAWQVGKRSDTEDYNERIQLDTWYIQNYSLWLDLKILFKTVTSMLHGKGSY